MPKNSMLGQLVEGLADGVGQVVADIQSSAGNAYVAALSRDAGWDIQHSVSTLTEERAQQISIATVEQEYSTSQEIEREI